MRIRSSSPAAAGAIEIESLSLVRYPIPCSTPVQTPELARVELPALPWVRSPALPSPIAAEFPKVASRVGSRALPRVSAFWGSQQPQRRRRGRGGAGAGGASEREAGSRWPAAPGASLGNARAGGADNGRPAGPREKLKVVGK